MIGSAGDKNTVGSFRAVVRAVRWEGTSEEALSVRVAHPRLSPGDSACAHLKPRSSRANQFLPMSFPVAAFVQILRTLLPIAPQGSAIVLRFAMRMHQELTNKPRVLYYTEAVAYLMRQ